MREVQLCNRFDLVWHWNDTYNSNMYMYFWERRKESTYVANNTNRNSSIGNPAAPFDLSLSHFDTIFNSFTFKTLHPWNRYVTKCVSLVGEYITFDVERKWSKSFIFQTYASLNKTDFGMCYQWPRIGSHTSNTKSYMVRPSAPWTVIGNDLFNLFCNSTLTL